MTYSRLEDSACQQKKRIFLKPIMEIVRDLLKLIRQDSLKIDKIRFLKQQEHKNRLGLNAPNGFFIVHQIIK